MADPEPGEDTAPPARPDFSGNALRREPAIIEGTAEDLTPASDTIPDDARPIEVAGAATNADAAIEPEASQDVPPTAEEPVPDAVATESEPPHTAPRRSGILVPVLLSLVFGGVAGLGGAYALHYLDHSDADIDALDGRVTSVELQQTKLQRQQNATAASATAQADLANRLSAIETQSHADAAALASLKDALGKLAAQPPAHGGAPAPDLGPLTQQVAGFQGKLTALSAQVGDLSGKVAVQQGQVAAVQHLATQTAAAHAGDEAVAIITGSLLRKAEAGAPFADDLTALANHGIDKGEIAPLQPAAASGVATAGALARQFAAATDAILATAPAPKAHSFLDRLMKDAEGLVRVRKIGDTTGDSLAAQVARIQNALDAGSVKTAYQQWTALPEAAKDKSRAFGAAAKVRLDVIDAARTIEAEALAGLGKAKS